VTYPRSNERSDAAALALRKFAAAVDADLRAKGAAMSKCPNCEQREGEVRWGDALAFTHGWAPMWCWVCAYEAQLEHAKERAAAIPELERRLAEARVALGEDA